MEFKTEQNNTTSPCLNHNGVQKLKDKLIENQEKLLYIGATLSPELPEDAMIGAKIIINEICADLETIIQHTKY